MVIRYLDNKYTEFGLLFKKKKKSLWFKNKSTNPIKSLKTFHTELILIKKSDNYNCLYSLKGLRTIT